MHGAWSTARGAKDMGTARMRQLTVCTRAHRRRRQGAPGLVRTVRTVRTHVWWHTLRVPHCGGAAPAHASSRVAVAPAPRLGLLLGARCSVLGTRYSVLGACSGLPAQQPYMMAVGTQFSIPSNRSRAWPVVDMPASDRQASRWRETHVGGGTGAMRTTHARHGSPERGEKGLAEDHSRLPGSSPAAGRTGPCATGPFKNSS